MVAKIDPHMPKINLDPPKVKARQTFADKLKNLLTQTFQEPVDVRLSKLKSGYWIVLSFHGAKSAVPVWQWRIAAGVAVLEPLWTEVIVLLFRRGKSDNCCWKCWHSTRSRYTDGSICLDRMFILNLSLDLPSRPRANMFLSCFSVSRSFHKCSATTSSATTALCVLLSASSYFCEPTCLEYKLADTGPACWSLQGSSL